MSIDTTIVLDELADWIGHRCDLKEGKWNNRTVAWEDKQALEESIASRIEAYLLSLGPNSPTLLQAIARFALIGSEESRRVFVERDIRELFESPEGQIARGIDCVIVPVGLSKDLKNFWKEHKVAIIVGVALAATAIAIVVLSGGTAAAAASSVATSSGGALTEKLSSNKNRNRTPAFSWDPPTKLDIAVNSPSSQALQFDKPPRYESSPIYAAPCTPATFNPTLVGAQYAQVPPAPPLFPPSMPPPFPMPNTNRFESKAESLSSPQYDAYWQYRLTTPLQTKDMKAPPVENAYVESVYKQFTQVPEHKVYPQMSAGPIDSNRVCSIGFINGMDSDEAWAGVLQEHLNRYVPNQKVDLTYNKTNGKFWDSLEIFVCNYAGISPRTAKALQKKWTAFHNEFSDNPRKKYLQFCFSQGAIHVKNALSKLPQEIRNRVIVVGISPGAPIPKVWCYDRFNYTSANDFVYLGEAAHLHLMEGLEFRSLKYLEWQLEQYKKQFIILKAHPDAIGIDHDFRSPTFAEVILKHCKDFEDRNGEYQ